MVPITLKMISTVGLYFSVIITLFHITLNLNFGGISVILQCDLHLPFTFVTASHLIFVLCSNTKCKPLHISDLPLFDLVLEFTFSVGFFSRINDI